MYTLISYQTESRVIYITLNRPEKRNALNHELVGELKMAFKQAKEDDLGKVIVLKANGDVFSAGADLQYLQQLQKNTYEENLADSKHLMELLYQIYTHDKIIIAQIEGHAIAGGCGLTTACDFAFANKGIKMGYTEVKIGFIPAIVMTFLIRKIGETRAKELLLTGKLISSEEAEKIGLINQALEIEQMENHIRDFCNDLCKNTSASSLRNTKKMIKEVQEQSLLSALNYAADMNAISRNSEDCQRGIASFLNKEKLTW